MGFGPTEFKGKDFKDMTPQEKEEYAQIVQSLKLRFLTEQSLDTADDVRQRLTKACNYGMLFYPNGKMLSAKDVEEMTKDTASLTKVAADLIVVVHDPVHDTTEYCAMGVLGNRILIRAVELDENDISQKAEEYEQKSKEEFLAKVDTLSPKELIDELADGIQNFKFSFYKVGPVTEKLKNSEYYHDLNFISEQGETYEKGYAYLDGQIYIRGENTPATQEQFALYAVGLKAPKKPSGFLSGLREWFHKNIHPLKDFSEYEKRMKQYEVEKYKLCELAGFDVSGQTAQVDQYKADLAELNRKEYDAAKAKLTKIAARYNCEAVLAAFKEVAKGDSARAVSIRKAIPNLEPIEYINVSSRLAEEKRQAGIKHIDEKLAIANAFKEYLPESVQKEIDKQYTEAELPYKYLKQQLEDKNVSKEKKIRLASEWEGKKYVEETNVQKEASAPTVETKPSAPAVEETKPLVSSSKKPNLSALPQDKRLEFAKENAKFLNNEMKNEKKQSLSERAKECGVSEQVSEKVLDVANGGEEADRAPNEYEQDPTVLDGYEPGKTEPDDTALDGATILDSDGETVLG